MAILATVVALAISRATVKPRRTLTTRTFVDATTIVCGDALFAIIPQDLTGKARRTRVDRALTGTKLRTIQIITSVSITAVCGFLAGITEFSATTWRTCPVFVTTVASFRATFDRQATRDLALTVVWIAALVCGASDAFTKRDTLIFVVALLTLGAITRSGSALASEGLGIALLACHGALCIRKALDTKSSGPTTRCDGRTRTISQANTDPPCCVADQTRLTILTDGTRLTSVRTIGILLNVGRLFGSGLFCAAI